MWIINLLPEYIIHLIFAIGVTGVIFGFVLHFIPFIKQYTFPIQVISITVLAIGLYLEGALAENKEWQLQIKEMEAKISKLEAESAKTNVEIQEKVVEKIQVVREKGKDIIQYIDREVVKKEEVVRFIENCPIPQDIIQTHNDAAELNKPEKGNK